MLLEYLYLLIYLVLCLVLSGVIVFGSMLLITRTGDLEKVSAYECGFHPFEDTRAKFDVRFYLVAILFIIFDLEITFLFPYAFFGLFFLFLVSSIPLLLVFHYSLFTVTVT